jgi:hypothetical protein
MADIGNNSWIPESYELPDGAVEIDATTRRLSTAQLTGVGTSTRRRCLSSHPSKACPDGWRRMRSCQWACTAAVALPQRSPSARRARATDRRPAAADRSTSSSCAFSSRSSCPWIPSPSPTPVAVERRAQPSLRTPSEYGPARFTGKPFQLSSKRAIALRHHGIDATPVVHAVEILIRMPLYWAAGILRAMEKAASVKLIRHSAGLQVHAIQGLSDRLIKRSWVGSPSKGCHLSPPRSRRRRRPSAGPGAGW